MIKFFRKIRQNLLNEGKTARYFKYAIGEIVLVVIGILIAFQVNDWNKQRIEKNTETLYLKAIVSEIKSNIQVNQELIWSRIDKKLSGLYTAKAYAEESLDVDDPVKFIMAVSYAAVFSGGYDMGDAYVYEEMVNTGFMKSLSDNKLKKDIIDYYAIQITIQQRLLVYASAYLSFTNHLRPYDTQNRSELSEYDQAEALQAFKTTEFRKIVDAELSYTYKLRDYLTNQKRRGLDLIDLIETKLNQGNNSQ